LSAGSSRGIFMFQQPRITVSASFSSMSTPPIQVVYTQAEEEIRPSKSDRQLSHRHDRRNTAAELKVLEVISL